MHMPIGRPDEVQWHWAANLKELQNPGLFEDVADGQAAIEENDEIVKKQKNKMVNFLSII